MSNTIAEGLERIINAKAAIDTSITAKGGDVTIGLENTPSDIMTIPVIDPEPINDVLEEANDELEAALGGGQVAVKGRVNFYDYDGTLVKSMSSTQFSGLTNMPPNPTHSGLTSQGWNWSLSDAKTYVATYGSLDIGQMYTTDDGKTRIYISLSEGRISPILQLYLNANSELDVDWGDGSTHSTFTSTDADYVSERYEYATDGDYVISITVVSGGFELQSSSTAVSSILWNGNNSATSPDKAYNNAIKKIEIGNGVTSIGNNAFSTCCSLSSITIPDSVTSIGNYAFSGCYALSSITIPDGVTSIGNYAFSNCRSLTPVTIPDTVTTISISTFANCHSLTSITIPDTVTSIGNNVFQYCYSLSSITIPDTVTSIGNNVFYSCTSLSSITIGNDITSIGDNVFQYCYSLSSITIPDSVTTIGTYAFASCYSLISITIPDTVTSIDNYAFQSCSSLSSITISDTVTSIGNNAFQNCYSLSSITIPDTVTSIGNYAFQSCYSLSSITIPDDVKTISSNAFNGCASLSSITIGNGVTSIGNYAFQNCNYMSYIKFESTTPPTVSSSGVFSGVPTTTILYAPALVINLYMNGTNYPSKATYKYVGFATYASGVSLPTTTTDETYTLTWYATQADAIAETNPITDGNGSEVYARATPVT